MPDHFRQVPKDNVVPRSPPDPEHPLALVISGKRDHHLHGAMSPPKHPVSSSPGRSSGYSDHISSPERSPIPHHRVHDHEESAHLPLAHSDSIRDNNIRHSIERCQETKTRNDNDPDANVPLALVVPKNKLAEANHASPLEAIPSGDSGHDDSYSGGSSPNNHRSPRRSHSDNLIPDVVWRSCPDKETEETSKVGHSRSDITPNITIAKVLDHQDKKVIEELKTKRPPNPLKIRDFARMSSDGANDSHDISIHGKCKAAADDFSDSNSEVSSGGTWTTGSLKQFPQRDLNLVMRRQAKSVGGGELFPCDLCDKIFANKTHLQSHAVQHSGERSFPCKMCGKTFGRKSTLRAHMTTHTKSSNFMCPMCEKACNDNNSLEEHMRMHTGEKPFVCTICSKAYARKSHLNVHYRVHTGERPFVCVDCGKDFTEKRFLNDHMQTAHSGQDGPLKCPNCFREFAYKTSLKQHLKKQMCVKNINRSLGNTIHGHHAKQFQCPFCEKSYSWKQTLKQHVSMFHKNKVHTDEFWKYELAKHRRVGFDYSVNEDMWKKQLGRHADEVSKKSFSLDEQSNISEAGRVNIASEDKWLDQIQRSTSQTTYQKSQVASEMKLLALQSLQSSLHFMNADVLSRKRLEDRQNSTLNMGSSPSRTFLTKLSSSNGNFIASPPRSPSRSPSRSPMLPDIKEEPAAKRTQMWLAQLGRYRQRSLFQEELDRNHEELWEEQIAKAKTQASKLPLAPVEITLDEEPPTLEKKDQNPVPIEPLTQPPKPNFVGMFPLMSALQVHPPPRPKAAPSATITRPPSEEETPPTLNLTTLPAKYLRLSDDSVEPKKDQAPRKDILQITEEFKTDEQLPVVKDTIEPMDKEKSEPVDITKEPEMNSSVLKSILLEGGSSRKRSSLTNTAPTPKPGWLAKDNNNSSSCNDILRRRLLGIKDPICAASAPTSNPSWVKSPPSRPTFAPNNHLLIPTPPCSNPKLLSARSTLSLSRLSMEMSQGLPKMEIKKFNNSTPSDQPKEDDKSSTITKDDSITAPKVEENTASKKPASEEVLSRYTHTSVLKHLLNRYTGNSSEQESSANPK